MNLESRTYVYSRSRQQHWDRDLTYDPSVDSIIRSPLNYVTGFIFVYFVLKLCSRNIKIDINNIKIGLDH